MLIKKLIIGLLSFYTFDFNKNIIRSEINVFNEVTVGRELETKKKKEAEKKKTKLYDKRIWKKKKFFREKNLKLSGSHAKDKRFSNQKLLRKMYRNS